MPFTYLGLPLGTTKPSVQDFSPLLNRIERKMSGFSRLLSYDGRLILVNAILSALPTFYMCSLKIPPQVVRQIDLYRKHCLWSKGDINRKGSRLVAWETTCKPKNHGGLDIIDIEKQNDALLMKHLNSFYNHHDLPWVNLTWSKLYSNSQTPPQARCPVGSFWWKDLLKLFTPLKNLIKCDPSRGNTDLFWSGSWSPLPLKEKYPHLFSFSKKPKCSIRYFLDNELEANFSLPLSSQATEQLAMLLETELDRPWDESTTDIWSYSSGNATFSSKATYKFLIGVTKASPLFSWVWKSSNPRKHKFFFYFLLRDRLNTTNLLRRKHMHLDDYSYVLCNTGCEETSFHLFFE